MWNRIHSFELYKPICMKFKNSQMSKVGWNMINLWEKLLRSIQFAPSESRRHQYFLEHF